MVRLRFKLPAEGSPFSGTTRVLGVDVAHAHLHDVTEALRELVDRLPEHPGIIPILDAGITDGRLFIVTPHIAGESLDAALGTYGPAALADALPRLQHLADALDTAARNGLCHGALTPADIIVSADDTRVTGIGVAATLSRVGLTPPMVLPYAAPESVSGQPATSHSDQYALAAIAYEWLLGQRLDLSRTGLAALALPGVDIAGLTRAFERALASAPADRFPTCTAFVSGIAESVGSPEEAPTETTAFSAASPSGELPLQFASDAAPARALALTPPQSRGYGPLAMAAALIVGLAIGALAMRVYGPHAVASNATPSTSIPEPAAATSERVRADRPVDSAREITEAEINAPDAGNGSALPPDAPSPAPPATADAAAAQRDAGLLVHSSPAGALVTVDGVPRGTTPVAVRGLDLGARTVLVSQRGYRAIERQVVLTSDRPSRTLELELSPEAAVRPARQSAEGSVAIDSRPAGATVFVDGREAGVTPLTLALPPGQYTVRMERTGYRAITTRVNVKGGERTRVAARLEGGQDEE